MIIVFFCYDYQLHALSYFKQYSKSLNRHPYQISYYYQSDKITTYLQSNKDSSSNNLDNLLLDTSSLDEAEQNRLKNLQQINADADNILRRSGINYQDGNPNDETIFDKSIEDTQWTGQSTSERSMTTYRDWRDVAKRPFLSFCDFAALLLFAIIGDHCVDEQLNCHLCWLILNNDTKLVRWQW